MTTTTTTALDVPAHDWDRIGQLYRAHLSKGRATLGELFGGHIETESEGAWITTHDGRRFLNCGSYGVLITGARHPVVVRHVMEQLHRHPVASRVFLEPQAAFAAEALVARAPKGLERVHFAGSGAEAVETAIKIARTLGKDQLIATDGGYHGKTMGALSLTGKDLFQAPFRPLLPGTHHVPYGDAEALEELLRTMPGRACFVVEPVQGEAGVVLPPPGYLRAVQELCRAYDAFFVLDEIQTGLGRLGSWWGADEEAITPDALLAGKALGGGVLPVSAVIATPQAFRAFDKDPYLHTSTFSGTPLAMAAVRGALAAVEQDGLVGRARELGAEMLTTVREIATRHYGPVVREVRGKGLLIGIEFAIPGPAGDLLIELIQHGVVANHSLNSHLVLRLTPPAVLTASDTRYLYEALDRSCRAQAARYIPTLEGDSDHA
ncbi:aspartate aminotransferase family protein [Streptomyces mutabilis]|uniref:aspartate aminotransferase family protein n=1 Tax=Streptomyces mutabilis TaxID=67332 RepID=UPI00178492E7|nr:aminotransferase class III-fold pyridoxal phosphate-dependent enzyme [Streptomyces mutabilis]GGQ49032.1 putative ornithine aminotransferase [Streptomyces mutabilis]